MDVWLLLVPLKGPHTGQNLFGTFIDVFDKEFGILRKYLNSLQLSYYMIIYKLYKSYGGYHQGAPFSRGSFRSSCLMKEKSIPKN